MNWLELFIGGVLGLLLAIGYEGILKRWNNWRAEKKLAKALDPYKGEYDVSLKDGGESNISEMRVMGRDGKVLFFECLVNNSKQGYKKAKGEIVVDTETFKTARGYYHHEKEVAFGYYQIQLLDGDKLFVDQTFWHKVSKTTVARSYFWKKKSG